MIQLQEFTFNGFAENTYVLSDDSKACIIIDPGCYAQEEKEELVAYIKDNGLQVEKIINTHCHIDHVLGNQFCKATFQVKLYIPPKEVQVLKSIPLYAATYGFPLYQEAEVDGFLPESGTLTFGESALEILFVPGHSPGHLAFYAAEENFCVNGDVLFQGSIGRTDLPGGNHEQLIQSIQQKMFALPDNTVIYCGHGSSTTIAFEKQHNPFCAIQ